MFGKATLKEHAPEAAAAILAIVLALMTWLGVRYVEETGRVRHMLEVEKKITGIWSLLQDAEIGQRSFVLTGDETFLQPYTDAAAKIQGEVAALSALVVDNPEQVVAVATVRPLIAQRLAFAGDTINIRRTGNFESARGKVLQGRGRDLMQQLRQQFQYMQQLERDLLLSRTASAGATTWALIAAVILGLLGTVGVLGAWIINVRRSTRKLAAANVELQEMISGREAAELQLRQMQKMEAVGQLTGGIAHDFNNMLAIIISGITLATKRMAKGEAGAEDFLSRALEGAQRAAVLVARLLAFSRQQALDPKPLDVNKLIMNLSELIARPLGEMIKMETVLAGGLWQTTPTRHSWRIQFSICASTPATPCPRAAV